VLTFVLAVFPSWGNEQKELSVTTIGAKGFFRLKKEKGVWWFLSPEGNKFVSLGINHIEPVLLSSDTNKALFMEKYGNDLIGPGGRPNNRGKAAQRWLEDSMNLVQQWGFNSLGVHNPIPQSRMPYVAKFRPARIDGWAGLNRQYMDPFAIETQKFIEERAEQWCARHKDDTMILGISLNDMPQWQTSPKEIHAWVQFCMELDETSPGKKKWVEVLQGHYSNLAAAAAAYGIEASSWNGFLERTSWPEPAQPEKVFQDVQVFLPLIADNWFHSMVTALRKYDHNHLIFGDKFEGKRNLPLWLDLIIMKYFDLAYIQWYDYAHIQTPRLKKLYEITGKPILMGDSSFSCPNPNNPRPKGVHVGSQKEVGNAYYTYLHSVMEEPYVVGWHFCGFIEGSPDLKKHHYYFSIQNGLLKPDGTPYQEAIDRVVAANVKAQAWHENAVPVSSTADAKKKSTSEPLQATRMADTASRETDNTIERCRTIRLENSTFTRIDNNVYNLGGFSGKTTVPKKNISWVVTDEGVVVIDTGSNYSARMAMQQIRETTDKPVRYIIYTHHHGTQVSGTRMLMSPETEVIAHEDLVIEFDLIKKFYNYNARLNSIQFNLPYNPEKAEPVNWVYPDITYKSEYSFSLGGNKFELYHVVGEAQDYTIVFLPDQKIVWIGDMLGGGMPMVASPMKLVRDEVKWKKGLELIKGLKPEVLLQSVQQPFCDQSTINRKLDVVIEYLDFLHESIAREMNAGSSLEETLINIQLPEHMRRNALLRENYGKLQFNIRGLYHRYSGWFDQNGTHLNPAPAKERAEHFIKDMGGGDKVLQRVRELEQKSNYKLALEYLDLLIVAGSHLKNAHETKGSILRKMSIDSRHTMTAKMYRRLATMEDEKARQLTE
jgi:glyoxylase-like metal-dependent hydrolase (beta-lactamase superfamily II)